MSGFRQFSKEIGAIFRSPKVLISVFGVIMIPVLYSALFLGAFWDPYAKMDRLPVAIVNSDEGTTYEGQTMNIGEKFIEKLQESGDFYYTLVDEAQAQQGLSDNTYYMGIEIPSDFSRMTTTLTSGQPEPAEIIFLANESKNFLAAQIGTTAIEKMKSELSAEITKTYAETIFGQIEALAAGLNQASAGAGEIATGTESAKSGAELIEENLNKLNSGSVAMKSGIVQLVDGASKLTSGTSDLQKGSSSLSDGLDQLNTANSKLVDGSAQANLGATQLSKGLAESSIGAGQLEAGAQGLANGLQLYASANPELAEDAAFQQLLAISKQIADGATAVKLGQDQLAMGAGQLTEGTDQLVSGLTQFGSKLESAATGAAGLTVGADQLHAGAQQLDQGLGSLSQGFNEVVDGSSKLGIGAQQMTEGLVKLTDGTSELSNKLNEAADKTSSIHGGESVTGMFSKPVELQVVKSTEVPNYGTGFSPYFISLGLFVGALILTIVLTLKEPAVLPKSGWSWFVGKMLTMVSIGTVQAILVDLVLLYGLGLEVASLPMLFLFSIITSITFMMIIQFLVTAFKDPGRYVAIIILILQLTSSAGTFPMELIPNWLQKVGTWLPMTYSVSGLKAVISSGDYSFMWSNIWILLAFAVVFAALTLTYFIVAYRKEYKNSSEVVSTV